MRDGTWDARRLRGSSALYASDTFLREHTNWETLLIGWPGEIWACNKKEVGTPGIPGKLNELADITQPLQRDERLQVAEKIRHRSPDSIPVWLDSRPDQTCWRQYAERVVWPVLHYQMPDLTDCLTKWWQDYISFNEAYADRVTQVYKPGDMIVIHDYYLFLLPGMLRARGIPNSAQINFFLHTPFSSSEYFRCIPQRVELLQGILGSTQVGFQCASFQEHFVSSCTRLLNCRVTQNSVYGSEPAQSPPLGHPVESAVNMPAPHPPSLKFLPCTKVAILPLGIDVEALEAAAFSPQVDTNLTALLHLTAGCKLIVGRDRLDDVHGVVLKLKAFEQFLEMYPQWRGHAMLLQVSYTPIATGAFHSAAASKEAAEIVTRINGNFGALDYTPVLHCRMPVRRTEYLALLRAADLCLVCCARDGMNTTALEYVVCQHGRGSPLILSEFSAAAGVLGDARLVNPADRVGVARALNDCLSMEAGEAQVTEDELYASVCRHSVQKWTLELVQTMKGNGKGNGEAPHIGGTAQITEPLARRPSAPMPPAIPAPALDHNLLVRSYKESHHRLFLFDYDGTLTPIVKRPEAAIPSARLIKVLQALVADPANEVWINSGRDQKFLDGWFATRVPGLGLSGEHGCFMKPPGCTKWTNLVSESDMSWQPVVESVFARFTKLTPGSCIEHKRVAVTWHYRNADPVLGPKQGQLCHRVMASELLRSGYTDVDVTDGKANVEVRPRFVNKGEIARRLVLCRDPLATNPEPRNSRAECPDFVLCVGDDTTDEDMFRTLRMIGAKWARTGVPDSSCAAASFPYGLFSVTVGPADKPTLARANLRDPAEVIGTAAELLGD